MADAQTVDSSTDCKIDGAYLHQHRFASGQHPILYTSMTTAQEILNQPDVFLAIQQKRIEKQAEIEQMQKSMAEAFNNAFAPLPRATNRVEYAMQLARNAFNIWQGISMGLKIVRGFRKAFSKQ